MPRKAMPTKARRPRVQRQRTTPPTNGGRLAVQALAVLARHDDLLLQTHNATLTSLPDATHVGTVMEEGAVTEVLFPCSKRQAEQAAEQALSEEIFSWGLDEDEALGLMVHTSDGGVYADIEGEGPWDPPSALGDWVPLQGSIPWGTLLFPRDRTSLAVAVRSCPAPTQDLKQSARLRSTKLPSSSKVFVTVLDCEGCCDSFRKVSIVHRTLLGTVERLADVMEEENGTRREVHGLMGANGDTAHARYEIDVGGCGSGTWDYRVPGHCVQRP